jgi:hypothetical protein
VCGTQDDKPKKACQHAFGKDSVIECTNKNKYLYRMGKLMQLTMSEDNYKRTKNKMANESGRRSMGTLIITYSHLAIL